MLKIAFALLALLSSPTAAGAQATLTFGGEPYVRKHEQMNEKAAIIEFVPAEETLEDWTRLVGFHGFWHNKDTAAEAAQTLARLAAERYPDGAKPRVRSKGAEALVDFVAKAPNSDVLEFNVFKYGRAPDGRGIVAFQFARRFRGLDPEDVRTLCGRSIAEAAGFDLKIASAALKGSARRATTALLARSVVSP